MTRNAVQALLDAPYGHHVKVLPNGGSSVTLIGVPGGPITRESDSFEDAIRQALDAAKQQEAAHAK